MALLPVEKALAMVTGDVTVVGEEDVPLMDAVGRILAQDIVSRLTQPPFDSSAMDGYAVRGDDVTTLPATLEIVGESAAGHGFDGNVGPRQAARIFTGAPVPRGADTIVIQEEAERDGDRVTILKAPPKGKHIRNRGIDFKTDEVLLAQGRKLNARDVALAAAANHAALPCRKRPRVAILATGDELVMPGATLEAEQIISSIPYGLAPLIRQAGGDPDFLGIAQDSEDSLKAHIAKAKGADVMITIGGASVGKHDLVGKTLEECGMKLGFWKVAMRPGKPLIYGTFGGTKVLGVPGNPVSALFTARLFLVPLLARMLALPNADTTPRHAVTDGALPENGPRQHYMRAKLVTDEHGTHRLALMASQDSSLLRTLSNANALIIRPPHAPALPAGTRVPYLPLDF